MSDLSMTKNKKTIFLYAISKTHLRYIDTIEKIQKDVEIVIIYEKISNIVLENQKLKKKYKFIKINSDDNIENIFFKKPFIFFFTTAQLQINIIKILNYCLINNIPTIGIQEGNQIFLQQFTINNYILPLNYLLLSSNYERDGFISMGYNEKRLKVIGWINNEKNKNISKIKKNKIVLLSLLAPKQLNTQSIEDDIFRKKMFKLISHGLPSDYHLYVKPYPAENKIETEYFIKKHFDFKKIIIVDKDADINVILKKCDLLLNTGYSQVIFEAVSKQIPFLIINIPGYEKSQIAKKYKEICVNSSIELKNKIKNLDNLEFYYKEIKNTHYPFTNKEVSSNFMNLIRTLDLNFKQEELIRDQIIWCLYINKHNEARKLLNKLKIKENDINQRILSIVNKNATELDYKNIYNFFKSKIIEHAVVALYINFIIENNIFPSRSMIQIFNNFPPKFLSYSMVTIALNWKTYLLLKKQYKDYAIYSSILKPKITKTMKSFGYKKRIFYSFKFFFPLTYIPYYNLMLFYLQKYLIKNN